MASRTIALLCLAGLADGLVKRTSPSEGVATQKLGSLAASVTEAALGDVMTLGSARALEDVKQLAQVAQVAVADELGVSPSQAFSEDLAKKALLAAGDVAGNLVDALSGAAGATDDVAEDSDSSDAKLAARGREIDRHVDEAESTGAFTGAHAARHMADFLVQETISGIEHQFEDTVGKDVLDAPLSEAGQGQLREAIDMLGAMVADAEDAFEEDVDVTPEDEESQARVDMYKKEVSKKVAARVAQAGSIITELKKELARDSDEDEGEDSGSSGLDAETEELVDGVSELVGDAIDGAWSGLKEMIGPDAAEVVEEAAASVGDFVAEALDEEEPLKVIGEAASNVAEGVVGGVEDFIEETTDEQLDALADKAGEVAAPIVEGVVDTVTELLDAAGAADEGSGEAGGSGEDGEAGGILAEVAGGVGEIVDAVAPDVAPAIEKVATAVEALGGEGGGPDGDEEVGEVVEKVASGLGELADAVVPAIQEVGMALAEALDEEEDEEDEDDELDMETLKDREAEDEELDMRKQESKDDDDEDGIAGKLAAGLEEVVEAVAPVVTEFIDTVEANLTDGNTTDDEDEEKA